MHEKKEALEFPSLSIARFAEPAKREPVPAVCKADDFA